MTRIHRRVLAGSAAICLLLCHQSTASTLDRMECFRVRDSLVPAPTVTSDLLAEYLPDAPGCVYTGTARQVCRPVTESVRSSTWPLRSVEGDAARFYQICYRVKCPWVDVGSPTLNDAFGTRVMTQWKRRLICLPANLGATYEITIRVTNEVSLAALQFNIDYAAANGDFEGNGASVSCTSAVGGFAFMRDDDDERSLRVALLPAIDAPVVGPADVLTCRFARLDGAPPAEDFGITNIVAVNPGSLGVTATVEASSVTLVP